MDKHGASPCTGLLNTKKQAQIFQPKASLTPANNLPYATVPTHLQPFLDPIQKVAMKNAQMLSKPSIRE